ncbi:hypothetical protein GJ496_004071 [Pomphorhynchus laevis]|nr:hypothetical protein GJ496_004071 [Pomphorhynchus laevis]
MHFNSIKNNARHGHQQLESLSFHRFLIFFRHTSGNTELIRLTSPLSVVHIKRNILQWIKTENNRDHNQFGYASNQENEVYTINDILLYWLDPGQHSRTISTDIELHTAVSTMLPERRKLFAKPIDLHSVIKQY